MFTQSLSARLVAGALAALVLAAPLQAAEQAADLQPRDGWAVHPSSKDYATLLADMKAAVRDHKMGVVTEVGPTGAAAARGITFPGNRVVGVFANDYAVQILDLSTAAMIEAPIRFYVTEGADGTATLSYKTPSHVFAPYLPEAGEKLAAVAEQLDGVFGAIATAALRD